MLGACWPAAISAQFREDDDPTEIALSGKTPESIILAWPTYSYRLARLMIAAYGQPTESSDHRLVWIDNGPWKKTIIHRETSRVLRRNKGRLEQSAAYRVPEDRLGVLARFDGKIEADVKEGRLTVRSDSENENFLVLNLADEVIKGRRTAQEASVFRRKVSRLQDAGKSSPYLEGLLFGRGDETADPENPD